MNKAGLLLLVPAGLALTCAAAETPPPRKLSERITQEIRATLPAYNPLPAAAPVAAETPPPPDPDVLVLPNLVVKEKYQQKFDAVEIMTPKEQNKKFARDYRNSLHGLDAVLNSFTIPFLSPSPAARGRALYQARQLDDLNRTIEATGAIDPGISAELKKAARDMQRADEWQNRPAGAK